MKGTGSCPVYLLSAGSVWVPVVGLDVRLWVRRLLEQVAPQRRSVNCRLGFHCCPERVLSSWKCWIEIRCLSDELPHCSDSVKAPTVGLQNRSGRSSSPEKYLPLTTALNFICCWSRCCLICPNWEPHCQEQWLHMEQMSIGLESLRDIVKEPRWVNVLL